DPNLNDRPHLLDPLTKRPGLARLHPVEVVGVVLANRSQDVHRGPRFHSGVLNLLILIIKGSTAPRNSGPRFFRVARSLSTVAAGRLLRARARFLFRAVAGLVRTSVWSASLQGSDLRFPSRLVLHSSEADEVLLDE